MRKFTVTVLNTTGIQPYIFGSNRLRENIGASYLVSQATDSWAREALEKLKNQIKQEVYAFNPEKNQPDAKPHIEDDELAAELIYAGGGNTVLLFSDKQYALQFTQILSKRILEEAPGINLVAVHKEFDWDNQSLYEVVQDLMRNDLDTKKQSRIPSAPLLGLGVTATCRSTQLVAVGMSEKFEDDEPYLISREIQKKLDAVRLANRKLRERLINTSSEIYEFPLRTDYMGRSAGDSSYVAVIHADGNGMGKRFQKFGNNKCNRDYIIAMRQLSHSVNQAGITALKNVVDILVKSIEIDKDRKRKVKEQFEIKDNYLPFRPLVYGGDDVTFVCDGRLGLELATLYLKELEKQPIADGKPIKACAGICVVKTHYPFARAYQLSEELCCQAKCFVKEERKKSVKEDFSALDWHLAASGLIGSISEIRQREYQVQAGSLAMRPISLKKERDSDWRTWKGFTKVVKHFNEDDDWKGRRNKVIALREVLRQGIDATQKFLKNYQIKDEQLPLFPEFSGQSTDLAKKGWLNGICGYFDAIEAMDFYISLREESDVNLST
ncbi:Cas10/Cmr2 second palm domain-containing protein [Coleofasciculus chthonoplastes]|uniref:Cas10/Cmr2 second palm domain-containing protein n=1 Tax=Coleofasciculus chthonoplastes TaxID=64178 RepID=UPI0032F6A906